MTIDGGRATRCARRYTDVIFGRAVVARGAHGAFSCTPDVPFERSVV